LPVILDDDVEFYEEDPETEQEKLISPPRLFDQAGIQFAISCRVSGGGGRNRSTSSAAARHPWWQAAVCVRNGMSVEKALQCLTIHPARILGLDDRLGSVAVGKDANLQILSGEPLKAATWVETVILDGKVCYERSKDERLKRLLARPEDDQKDQKQK
jgi:imidazolonepropionase-like amidohydrolase